MDAKVMIQDLAKALATQKSIDKKAALAFVQSFFDVILDGLKEEKYVKIKGLGTFKLVDVESRESMNIHTGERFEIQGHAKIGFTPDATLKDLVNKPFAHFETVPLADDVTEAELEAVDAQFENTISVQESDFSDVESDSAGIETTDETVDNSDDVYQEVKSAVNPTLVSSTLTASVASDDVEEVAAGKSSSTPVEFYPEVSYENTKTLSSSPEVEVENTDEVPVESARIASVLSEDDKSEIKPEDNQTNMEPEEEKEYLDYIDDSEESERRKIRRYEWIFGSIFALIAMGIGYFIGYVHLASRFPNEVEVIVVDTVYIEKEPVDSTKLPQTEPVIKRDETTPPLKTDTKAVPKTNTTQPAKSVVQEVKPAKPAPQPEKQPVQSAVTSDYSKYPQVAGGAYWIVGTAQTYKVRSGETIRIIAERFFGSRQMAPYIIKYNGISDPDHVAEGTILNVPKLESKKK
jgi:nucleoid DNA-binding protein